MRKLENEGIRELENEEIRKLENEGIRELEKRVQAIRKAAAEGVTRKAPEERINFAKV